MDLMTQLTQLFMSAPSDSLIPYLFQGVATLCLLMAVGSLVLVYGKNSPVMAVTGFAAMILVLRIWEGSPDRVLRSAFTVALSVVVIHVLVRKVLRDRAEADAKAGTKVEK